MKISQPVIVIGMHRSGTTLMAKLLEASGIFMGSNKDRNWEPMYFIKTNDWMLKAVHATWDCPEMTSFGGSYSDAFMKEFAKDSIRPLGLLRYAGWKGVCSRHRKSLAQDYGWGWKDPRNSLTIPIWKHVFPRCKVVHIYRNPFDVASSLKRRSEGFAAPKSWRVNIKEFLRTGDVDYFGSLRCLSFEEGIKIWEFYVTCCLNSGEDTLHVKYEDLIGGDHNTWKMLEDYVGRTLNVDWFRDNIDVSRRNAFSKGESGSAVEENYQGNDLMKKLGYLRSGC